MTQTILFFAEFKIFRTIYQINFILLTTQSCLTVKRHGFEYIHFKLQFSVFFSLHLVSTRWTKYKFQNQNASQKTLSSFLQLKLFQFTFFELNLTRSTFDQMKQGSN